MPALLAPPAPGRLVVPKHFTPRDPSRKTYGGAVAKIAAARRRPLMPHQQLIADVAGEVDAEGFWVYPLIVVTMQRQAGKTDLDLSQSVQRCLMAPNRRVWHTAQTGQDAREKWDELVDEVVAKNSPLRQFVRGRPLRSNGKEALTFKNGSKLRPHPPTRESLHGKQSDINNVDEGWAFDEEQGANILQAITPSQGTRFVPPFNGAQTFVWSAAGDASSTWFKDLVKRGRAGEPGMAFFEWGMPEDCTEEDAMDLDLVARYHPAFGYTMNMRSLKAARTQLVKEGKAGEFARAYGNLWTGALERLFPRVPWENSSTDKALPAGVPAFGVASAEDGSMAAVVAVVADELGQPWGEVIAHRPGRAWVAEYLVERVANWPGAIVVMDRKGPAAPIADAFELLGGKLHTFGPENYAAACQDFHERTSKATPVLGHAARFRQHDALDLAAGWVVKRRLQDGGWVYSRTRSGGDISTLEALTVGSWAVARQPTPQEWHSTVWG